MLRDLLRAGETGEEGGVWGKSGSGGEVDHLKNIRAIGCYKF